MPFRGNRKNNKDDNMDQENSSSKESSASSRRQRNEALALIIGRLSSLTKNTSSTPLVIDTSLDTKIKVDEESPTGSAANATATTVSISTIESEQRLAMSNMSRSPQFANALLSPSFQLPSPTEESPKNDFQVTFAKKFSHMFDTGDEDEDGDASVLGAIDEEENEDGKPLEDNRQSIQFEQVDDKEEITIPGELESRENMDYCTEEHQASESRLAILEEIEAASQDTQNGENDAEPQSDPFLAVRQGELQIPDRKGRPPPSPSLSTARQEDHHDTNEDDGLVDDQSVHSQTSENTYASKISRFSMTQELLNSPIVSRFETNDKDSEENTPNNIVHVDNRDFDDQSILSENTEKTYESKISRFSMTQALLNSPMVSTIGHNDNEDYKENAPQPFTRNPQNITDSPASKVSCLSFSDMNSPIQNENQEYIFPRQPKTQVSLNDAFIGSRLSMAGEIEVLGEDQKHESTNDSVLDTEGRPPLVPILPRSKALVTSSNSDWDFELDPVDLFRYGKSIAQGRPPRFPNPKKDCGRYKTLAAVHQRLQEACPDGMDWDEVDPVLVDRYRDSPTVDFASNEERSTRIPDPIMDCNRRKTEQVVLLRLQQSSPNDSDWHEKGRDMDEKTTIRIDSESQCGDFQQLQAQGTAWDQEEHQTDNANHYSDRRGDDHENSITRVQGPSFRSDQSLEPTASKRLASTTRWYKKTGALPQISHRGSGPVDFDEIYENTYQETDTLHADMPVSPHTGTVYLLWKQRGQSIGVYFRKFKRRHGIYVESLDPNGLACRASSESRTNSRRSFFSVFKRNKGMSWSSNGTPTSHYPKARSVGRLTPGMKIDMINGQPCPTDLQVCTDIIVQTSGWLNLHIS